MKEYTYVVINTTTGESEVLAGFSSPGSTPWTNPRSSFRKQAFRYLISEGWRPVRETPMGSLAELGLTKASVNESILVLMERDSTE
jgi:hypothetical protein